MSAQLPEQLLGGHLTSVPVLVLATKGTDAALVARSVAALGSAGAQVSGTWWLTDSWRLDKAERRGRACPPCSTSRPRTSTASVATPPSGLADLLSKAAAPAASTAADPTAPVRPAPSAPGPRGRAS